MAFDAVQNPLKDVSSLEQQTALASDIERKKMPRIEDVLIEGPEQVIKRGRLVVDAAIDRVKALAITLPDDALTAPAEVAALQTLAKEATRAEEDAWQRFQETVTSSAEGVQPNEAAASVTPEKKEETDEQEKVLQLVEAWKKAAITAEQNLFTLENQRRAQPDTIRQEDYDAQHRQLLAEAIPQLDGLIKTFEWMKASGYDRLESDLDAKIHALTQKRNEWQLEMGQ